MKPILKYILFFLECQGYKYLTQKVYKYLTVGNKLQWALKQMVWGLGFGVCRSHVSCL